MTKNYLANHRAKATDLLQAGVKGMRWGVRKDRSGSSKTASTEAPKATTTSSSEPKQVVGAASGEHSSERYTRLAEQAKSGKAGEMSEQDLKFFNARTEALSKVAKMNETKPGWVADTAKKVVQQTAANLAQEVASGVSKKYLSGPLLEAINKKPSETIDDAVRNGIASKSRQEAIRKGIEEGLKTLEEQKP